MNFTQIKETCLYVNDLEITKAFYTEKLGLKMISFVPGRHVFFRAGTSVFLCFNSESTKNEKEIPPHFGSGNLHLAFECEKKDYEAYKAKVLDSGISIEHEHLWGNGTKSFYFRDPDHHCIEIVEPGLWD
ncbi:VOC family protein [Flexithrix dorotheae]|uniref:VOC family protein n=1 Tax=Flexithrix dorotheae TaxID=70993 RepID=UPI00036E7850|nr:VOC family protein [Flexithrix dorotheae]